MILTRRELTLSAEAWSEQSQVDQSPTRSENPDLPTFRSKILTVTSWSARSALSSLAVLVSVEKVIAKSFRRHFGSRWQRKNIGDATRINIGKIEIFDFPTFKKYFWAHFFRFRGTGFSDLVGLWSTWDFSGEASVLNVSSWQLKTINRPRVFTYHRVWWVSWG